MSTYTNVVQFQQAWLYEEQMMIKILTKNGILGWALRL